MDISGMRVISVDDNKMNLLVIENYAKALNLEISSFSDPREGLYEALEKECDIIVVDYMMPSINGLDFIEAVRRVNKDVPIIMLTAIGDDIDLQIKALELGATDFLGKPVNAPSFKARMRNLLGLRKSQLIIQDRAAFLEDEVKKATQTILDREYETLVLLGKTAEYRDPETGAHIARVSHYARLLAEKAGLPARRQEIIFYAAPFHDIGKVGIPDSILLKPGKLDKDEFEIIKTHTTLGYELLRYSKSDYLKAGGIISFTHHEKYDGSGYPKGLKGEAIPIYGRIIAIADVFDALTSKRPYKEAWSFEDTIEYIRDQRGRHFDPQLVDLFIEEMDEVKRIFETMQD